MNRETWLNELATLMAPRFAELGYTIPAFRVSIGFTSGGKTSKANGEAWHKSRSADGRFEILVSIGEANPMQVAAILAHELAHCAVGFKEGHKGKFAKCMADLGMVRPFTSSVPGDNFKAWTQPHLEALGDLPHAALMFTTTAAIRERGEGEEGDDEEDGGSSNQKKKQSTRMLKAKCHCGYTVRLTKKWATQLGACCPVHGAMEVEGLEEAPDDEGDEE